MGTKLAWAALFLSCASLASAQAPDAGASAPTEASADAVAEGEGEGETVAPAGEEPMPETPPGYETVAVPTAPARTSGAAPRRTVVAPHQAVDDERAGAPATAPSAGVAADANVELALTLNGLVSFGGLGGSAVPTLFGNVDMVFAATPHVWLGLGVAFSYTETHSPGGFGVPETKFVTSSVQVPIIFQYYFDTPHVGAAIPTLRVQLTPGWSETPAGPPTPSTQAVTGNLTLLGGVTWMAASWFALRIIGGLSGGFAVNTVGPISISGNTAVTALVSAVARF